MSYFDLFGRESDFNNSKNIPGNLRILKCESIYVKMDLKMLKQVTRDTKTNFNFNFYLDNDLTKKSKFFCILIKSLNNGLWFFSEFSDVEKWI
jgi:hypothetical protein